eukprot:6491060-Amphidinium_carterae.3
MLSRESKNDGYVLNNYYKLVDVAKKLDPAHFNGTPDAEVLRIVSLLEEEGIELPSCTKKSIVQRHIDALVAECNYEMLMRVINPFASEAWDAKQPCLSALGDTESGLEIWQKTVFEEALCNLINQGAGGCNKVVFLSKLTLEMLDAVDLLDLSADAAASVDEAMCILHSIRDLMTPNLESMELDCLCLVGDIRIVLLGKRILDGVPLCKESVRRLKAAAGRTQQSTLQMVGAALESTQYWSDLLSEYFLKAASTMEKRPVILKIMSNLSSMGDSDLAQIDALLEILQQVPSFVLAVRSGCLENFFTMLKGKVESYRSVLTPGTSCGLSSIDMKNLDKLFSSAAVVWPLDVQLQDDLNKVLALAHTVGKAETEQNVAKVCKTVTESDIVDAEKFRNVLARLATMLAETDLDGSLKEKIHENQHMSGAITAILSFMKHHWSKLDENLVSNRECCNVLKRMISALGRKSWETWACALECTVAMGETYGELQNELEAAPSEYCLSLARLESQTQKVGLPENYWESMDDDIKNHGIFATMTEYSALAVAYTSEIRKKCTDEVVKQLSQAIAEIKSVSVIGERNHWLDGFSGTCFDDLKLHADETLLKLNANALDMAINALKKAALNVMEKQLL